MSKEAPPVPPRPIKVEAPKVEATKSSSNNNKNVSRGGGMTAFITIIVVLIIVGIILLILWLKGIIFTSSADDEGETTKEEETTETETKDDEETTEDEEETKDDEEKKEEPPVNPPVVNPPVVNPPVVNPPIVPPSTPIQPPVNPPPIQPPVITPPFIETDLFKLRRPVVDKLPQTGKFMLKAVGKNNLCMDDGGGTAEGRSQFHLWKCNSSNLNQSFSYDLSKYQIKTTDNLCMDDGGGISSGSSKFHIWNCNSDIKDQHLVYDTATKQIRNPTKQLCLDDGGATQSGEFKARLWTCDVSTRNQQFDIIPLYQFAVGDTVSTTLSESFSPFGTGTDIHNFKLTGMIIDLENTVEWFLIENTTKNVSYKRSLDPDNESWNLEYFGKGKTPASFATFINPYLVPLTKVKSNDISKNDTITTVLNIAKSAFCTEDNVKSALTLTGTVCDIDSSGNAIIKWNKIYNPKKRDNLTSVSTPDCTFLRSPTDTAYNNNYFGDCSVSPLLVPTIPTKIPVAMLTKVSLTQQAVLRTGGHLNNIKNKLSDFSGLNFLERITKMTKMSK